MKPTVFLALLLVGLTSADEPLSQCTEEEVCSAIVFNQLAISEVKYGMDDLKQSLASGIKGYALDMVQLNQILIENVKELVAATVAGESGNEVDQEDLSRCRDQNEALKRQITSLEKEKNDGMQADQESYRKEIKDLKKSKADLQNLVQLQEDYILDLALKEYLPLDCADLMFLGHNQSGVYTIHPWRTEENTREVLCDMDSNGGGWTVFFTRQPQAKPIDFNQSWQQFKNGFGNMRAEFWLGNELLSTLTSYGSATLRIEAENFDGDKRWAQWGAFNVGDENSKYQLTLGQYERRSTLGDSLSVQNGSPFTTFDKDNDVRDDINCAVGDRVYKWGAGGFWYNNCGSTRPTAPLKNSNYWDSASWKYWNNAEEAEIRSFKNLVMMFRRNNYKELVDLHLPQF